MDSDSCCFHEEPITEHKVDNNIKQVSCPCCLCPFQDDSCIIYCDKSRPNASNTAIQANATGIPPGGMQLTVERSESLSHTICPFCLSRAIKARLVQGKQLVSTKIPCIMQPGICTGVYALEDLKNVLPHSIFIQLQQENDNDGVLQPKTDNAEDISIEEKKPISNNHNRQTPETLRQRVEQIFDSRRIRKCPTKDCSARFIRQGGCCRVKCTQCEKEMCYLCGKSLVIPIPSANQQPRFVGPHYNSDHLDLMTFQPSWGSCTIDCSEKVIINLAVRDTVWDLFIKARKVMDTAYKNSRVRGTVATIYSRETKEFSQCINIFKKLCRDNPKHLNIIRQCAKSHKESLHIDYNKYLKDSLEYVKVVLDIYKEINREDRNVKTSNVNCDSLTTSALYPTFYPTFQSLAPPSSSHSPRSTFSCCTIQ
jgi:hypothetical protein